MKHDYHEKASGNLFFAFILNVIFNVIVIIGSLVTNSVAIFADSMHDITDTVSIGLSWILEKVSTRDKNDSYTYGYKRFSILGASITSVFVIVISIIVIIESVNRLFNLEHVDAGGMLIVAILGIIFKGLSAYKLHGGITFNERAILLHLLGDIFEWVAILIISIILIFVDLPILDPLVSIAISIWLIYTLFKTLVQSLNVLLQKVPKNIDVKEFKEMILYIDGIKSIDDFHVWSLDGVESVLSLKIIVDKKDHDLIRNKINVLANEYNIVESTIEILDNGNS